MTMKNLKKYLTLGALGLGALLSPMDANAQSQDRNKEAKEGLENLISTVSDECNVQVSDSLNFVQKANNYIRAIQACDVQEQVTKYHNVLANMLKSGTGLVTKQGNLISVNAPDTLNINDLVTFAQGSDIVIASRNEEGIVQLPLGSTGRLNEYTKLTVDDEGNPILVFNELTPSGQPFNGYIGSKESLDAKGYLDSENLLIANNNDAYVSYLNEIIEDLRVGKATLTQENYSLQDSISAINRAVDFYMKKTDEKIIDMKEDLNRARGGPVVTYNPADETFNAGVVTTLPNGVSFTATYSTLSREEENKEPVDTDLGQNPNTGLPSSRTVTENVTTTQNRGELGIGYEVASNLGLYFTTNVSHGNVTTKTDQVTRDHLGTNELNVQQDQFETNERYANLGVGARAILNLDFLPKYLNNLSLTAGASVPVWNITGNSDKKVNYDVGLTYTIPLGGGNRK